MTQNAATRLLARVAKVEPEETPAVITAFLLFFCVLGGYFAVRPVRETVGTILGRERVGRSLLGDLDRVDRDRADLWRAVRTVPAQHVLCPWIYGFVALALVICGSLLRSNDRQRAGGASSSSCSSACSIFSWSRCSGASCSSCSTPAQTKRLFGAIAAGGTAGALVGPFLTDLLVRTIGNAGILFLGASMFVLAIVLPARADRALARAATTGPLESGGVADRPIGGNPFAGFRAGAAVAVSAGHRALRVLLASVNTFLYFEQMRW